MSVIKRFLLPALLAGLSACTLSPLPSLGQGSVVPARAAAPAGPFACGGVVEARTWQLWDAQGRQYLTRELVGTRLLGQGDPYALYDIQVQFHNLLSLAERCRRVDRLVQLADDLLPVYDRLEPLGGQPAMRAWVCRGGAVCSQRSRDLRQDEMLASVQGLGMLSALANALVHAPEPAARSHALVARTVQAILAHLLRWGGADARAGWARLATARPQDVINGSSTLFFTDRLLWQLAIHANLASIAVAQPALVQDFAPGTIEHRELAQAVVGLLRLFEKRLSVRTMDSPRLGRAAAADLDAGFWRLYGGNRYAGYSSSAKPALCIKTDSGMQVQMLVDVKTIPIVPDLGWDFSHARRLVQALEALGQNRHALQAFYDLPVQILPPPELARDFAAQLVTKIWNGDVDHPLFANYWNGSNGWYRVEVDSGTRVCHAGYPPFGLTNSFPTGGYATWGAYYPVIDELARTIYILADSTDANAVAFIRERYGGLSSASPVNRMVSQLMFWPSLVR